MKKLAVLGMGVCMVLAFSSCKSSESAYKKAYEKAKQQERIQIQCYYSSFLLFFTWCSRIHDRYSRHHTSIF